MREIRFRATHKDYKADHIDWINRGIVYFTLADLCDSEGFLQDGLPPIHDSDWRVSQFTGLHDGTGNEVYEGDIILDTWKGKTGVVEWDEDNGEWCRIWDAASTKGKYGGGKVIGNIYENPELLR